jgi:hypothetical protein
LLKAIWSVFVLLILAMLTGVHQYLIVWMVNDVTECLFICSFAIWMSSGEISVHIFCPIFEWVVFLLKSLLPPSYSLPLPYLPVLEFELRASHLLSRQVLNHLSHSVSKISLHVVDISLLSHI